MFSGYLAYGGTDIIRQDLTYALVENSECPAGWIRCIPCPGLTDALGDPALTVENAPWYDEQDPATHRFLGIYPVDIEGLEGSTRTAKITEGILDGGVVQGTRRAVREIRVRGIMIGLGHDGLDAGLSWLDKVLDGDTCGTHGTGCGEVDSCFFITCPPARPLINSFTPFVTQAENLATNPSFETTTGVLEVRRNHSLNPRFVGNAAWSLAAATGTWSTDGLVLVADTAATNAILPYESAAIVALPNETWTVSRTFSVPTGYPAVTIRLAVVPYAGGSSLAPTYSPTVTIEPGQSVLLSATATLPATTTGVRSIPYIMEGAEVGRRLAMTEALVEKTSVLRPYFDGATVPRLRVNRSTNPAFRASEAGWNGWTIPAGGSITQSRPSSGGPDDDWFRRMTIVTPGAGISETSAGLANDPVNLAPGEVVTLSMYVRSSKAVTVRMVAESYTRATATFRFADTGPAIVLQPDVWTRISQTTAVAALADTVRGKVAINGAGLFAPGDTFDIARYLSEVSPTLGDYLDGAVPAEPGFANAWSGTANASASYQYDTDLTAAWTGTVNASASVLRGGAIPGIGSAQGTPIRSTRWAESGSSSLRMPSMDTSSGGTFWETTQIPGATARGKTYTVIATTRAEEVLPSSTYTRRLAVRAYGSTTQALIQGPAAANVPGSETVRWTVTIPDDPTITGVSFRQYTSAAAGVYMPDSWWDDFLVVEGEYFGDYFDGNTFSTDLQNYRWTGTANASTSIYEIRSEIEVDAPDEMYDDILDPLRRRIHGVTAISGPLVLRHFHNENYHAYEVEFTLAAATPYVYGVPVILPPVAQTSTIIQDAPVNLVPYPSAELAVTTPETVVATNYSTNPSVETNTTGWTFTADGVAILGANIVGSRSTEIFSVGTASYLARWTAPGAGSNGSFGPNQEVTLPAIVAGRRFSINMWAFGTVTSGTAVLGQLQIIAYWRLGGTTLRTDVLGVVPVTGGAVSVRSIQPPPTATSVIVRAYQSVTSWSSGAVVSVFADALAVTVP